MRWGGGLWVSGGEGRGRGGEGMRFSSEARTLDHDMGHTKKYGISSNPILDPHSPSRELVT